MTEFKNIQWGEGTPIDYQRLGAMINNDQYLQDRIEPGPRGILMWKELSQFTINPNGAAQNLGAYTNLKFTTEANRQVEMVFSPGATKVNVAPAEARFWFVLDGDTYGETGTYMAASNVTQAAPALVKVVADLSAGEHNLTVQMISNAVVATLYIGLNGSSQCYVKDIGRSIDPTP